MSKIFRKYLPDKFLYFINFLKHIYLLFFSNSSYLIKTGFLKSFFSKTPVSLDNAIIPWMNYSIIFFLKNRLNNSMFLFEYGSGYSTFFYSKIVKNVTSVEHDKEWYSQIKKKIDKNVNLIFHDLDENYSKQAFLSKKKFNVIVIDGRDRVNCVINSLNALTEDGVFIFDDTKRDYYKVAYEFLLKNNFKRLDFIGLKPHGFRIDQTSIFYRNNNCLGI